MIRFLVVALTAVAATAAVASAQPTPVRPAPAPVATISLTAAPAAAITTPARESRLFELRTYYAGRGKLDALNARFRDHTVRLFEKHGITPIGFWSPVGNPDNKLIFLVAYPNRAARDAAWTALIADPEWTRAKRATETDGRLVEKIEEVFLTPTDFSPVVTPTRNGEPRLFELQTETVSAANADALNIQFRDHAAKLFGKHGVTAVGYWTVTNPAAGEATLIYLLAHKDADGREKAFVSLRSDPAWTTIKADADKKIGVPLTSKDGTRTVLLTPTDYSPLR